MFRKIEDHLQKNILISERVIKASTKINLPSWIFSIQNFAPRRWL